MRDGPSSAGVARSARVRRDSRRGRLEGETTVRAARRADLRAIGALFAESERMHAKWHPRYFRGDGELDPRVAEVMVRDTDGRAVLVAERTGVVVGFVHVELLEPRRPLGDRLGRRGHVDALVVSAGARRSGCGRLLFDAAAAWARARGAEELLLTVWAGNGEAERFYERMGLSSVSRVMKLAL